MEQTPGQTAVQPTEHPPTPKPHPVKMWIRVNLLSPYLKAIPRHQKTLDLACGWGFSFHINPDFHGIEYDENCVRELAKKHKVTRANILQELPFEPGSFDNCFAHDVLEHFELSEAESIFANVRRILRKDGRFIVIVPNRLGYDLGLRTNAGHKHYIVPEEIKAIAERQKFTVERSFHSPLPAIFDALFAHNKRVVICRKLED